MMSREIQTIELTNTITENLPFQYDSLKVFRSIRPVGFRYFPESYTIEAFFQGKQILVCGEAILKKDAASKALGELIERTALFDFPHCFHKTECKDSVLEYQVDFEEMNRCQLPLPIKNSNGWAAHISLLLAQESAKNEVIERDAVLYHWYTRTPFLQVNIDSMITKEWQKKELSRTEFPILKILLSTQGFAPTVTCLFLNKEGYGVCGHSAKPNLIEAIENAIGEACRAAHMVLRREYWMDSQNIIEGIHNTDIDSGVHAVHYAYHKPFPDWMFGKQIEQKEAVQLMQEGWLKFSRGESWKFHVQNILNEPLYVCFAVHPDAIPLEFGPTDVSA